MPADDVRMEEKRVSIIYDNRENKKNFANHKPHYLLVFSDETTETKSRAKLQGEKMDVLRAKLPAKKISDKDGYGVHLFNLEYGEYDGNPWCKVHDILPAMGSAGPGTGVPPSGTSRPADPPPAGDPPPPVNGRPSSLIEKSFQHQSNAFYNRLSLEKELAIIHSQAVNLAVERYKSVTGAMFTDDETPSPDFTQTVNNFYAFLWEQRQGAAEVYWKDLVNRCRSAEDYNLVGKYLGEEFILSEEAKDAIMSIMMNKMKEPRPTQSPGSAKSGAEW